MGKALSGELSCPCDRSCFMSVIICHSLCILLMVSTINNFNEI